MSLRSFLAGLFRPPQSRLAALNTEGVVLLNHGKLDEALARFNEVLQTNPRSEAAWQEILAAAYAELGDFGAAARWQTKAVEALAEPERGLAAQRLANYESHQPWREAV